MSDHDVPISPRRVLIIKPSAIGDIVHALPVLPRLKKRWPDAKISWMVNAAFSDLVRNHPLVDEVILFERKRYARGWYNPAVFAEMLTFTRDLQRREFDIAIDLQGLFRSAWITLASGAKLRVGFSNAREGAPLFYNQLVDCSWENDHAVERYLKIATALGCDPADPVEFVLAVDEVDREYVRGLIPQNLRYAVLCPGANWETKRWPAEHFAELAQQLEQKHGLKSVVAGSAADAKLAEQIGAAFNLAGKTNLRQIVALMERAELVVANDTGPMHIAAALGRPLVSPYGPTNAIRTGPYGRMDSVIALPLPCEPCYSRSCTHRSCLTWLKTDPVLELAERQMNGKNP